MKKEIHPEYNKIVFRDMSTNDMFLIPSTLHSNKKVKYEDGKEYPLVEIEITSASHPFYTGTQKLVDTAGRIERFRKKFKLDNVNLIADKK